MKKQFTALALATGLLIGGAHIAADEMGFYEMLFNKGEEAKAQGLTDIDNAEAAAADRAMQSVPVMVDEVNAHLTGSVEAAKASEVQRMEKELAAYGGTLKTDLMNQVNGEIVPAIAKSFEESTNAAVKRQKAFMDSLVKEALNPPQPSEESNG